MQHNHYGIEGAPAPAWNVDTWFNLPDGVTELNPSDFAGKVVYQYGFQSWCPGCHSHGFPTMARVQAHFADADDVAFVAIQTVFEGFRENGPAEAESSPVRHGLDIPTGHDPGAGNSGSPVMRNYRAGGTPWTVIIDPEGIVRFNGFQADADRVIALIEQLRTPAPA